MTRTEYDERWALPELIIQMLSGKFDPISDEKWRALNNYVYDQVRHVPDTPDAHVAVTAAAKQFLTA